MWSCYKKRKCLVGERQKSEWADWLGNIEKVTESQIPAGHSNGLREKRNALFQFTQLTLKLDLVFRSFSFSPAAHFICFWSQAIKSNEHLLPRVGSWASPLNIPSVAAVCFTCTWLFKQSGETCGWSLLASGLSRLSHKQSDPRSLIGSRPIEHFTLNPGLNPVAFFPCVYTTICSTAYLLSQLNICLECSVVFIVATLCKIYRALFFYHVFWPVSVYPCEKINLFLAWTSGLIQKKNFFWMSPLWCHRQAIRVLVLWDSLVFVPFQRWQRSSRAWVLPRSPLSFFIIVFGGCKQRAKYAFALCVFWLIIHTSILKNRFKTFVRDE